MFKPSQQEIALFRENARNQSMAEIDVHLQFGRHLFHSMFPQATIIATNGTQSTRWPVHTVLDFKSDKIRQTIDSILDEVERVCQQLDYALPELSETLPRRLGEILVECSLRIMSFGRDLTDLDYYLLNDMGNLFDISSDDISSRIEQTLYKIRKTQFRNLKPQLTEIQKEICAWLLIRAIRADNRVHPAEIKYFEIVSLLLDNDQMKLEHLERRSEELSSQLPMILTDEIAEFLFKYLVEIVMCDKDYDPEESQFIKEIARAFNFDQNRQDTILQPVAAALMVKSDLFQ